MLYKLNTNTLFFFFLFAIVYESLQDWTQVRHTFTNLQKAAELRGNEGVAKTAAGHVERLTSILETNRGALTFDPEIEKSSLVLNNLHMWNKE